MPQLNFNALASSGPQGFYKGFEQGQKEKVTSEINQINLEELKRDRDEMVQLQEKLKSLGQDPDVGKYLDVLAATGKPEYVKMAVEGRQKLKDLDAYAKLGVVEPAGTSPAMPTGAPAPVNALAPAPVVSGALGSGTFDPNAPAVPAAAPVPVNALAPAPVAAPATTMPVNALAPQPGADQIAPTQQRIRQLLDFARTNPRMATQAMAEAKILQDQLELYSKRGPTDSAEVQTMRAMGYPLTQAGYQAFRADQQKTPSDSAEVQTMKALGYPPTQAGYQAYRDAQRQERMLTPAEEAQRVRIAQASRAVTSKEDKAPSGYRFTKTGELEAIPGGPAAKVKEPTVSEQNASYNINRVLNAATEIKNVTTKDPSALAPGAAEATAQSMGMGGAANVARSSNRQIVYGAQRDALDALLYLATGAAYNKEQLQGAWDSYMPAYTDDTATRQAKQERLGTLLDDAKTRAGKAWTPKMETAMKSLMAPAAGTAAPAAGGKLSPAEQTELDALRKRFGK